MPDPLPTVGVTSGAIPRIISGGRGFGVTINTPTEVTVTPKLAATEDFSSLDNFVTVYGTPVIQSGKLAGQAVVRYKNQALTDSHKVSTVVGAQNTGTTRLVICGDESFLRYYALQISVGITGSALSIIRGTGARSVESSTGLIGALFSLFFSLFSLFSKDTTTEAFQTVTLDVDDEVSFWYDEDTSTLRAYVNDVEETSLAVPRGEIPHGPGFRWAGVAVGLDLFLNVLNAGPLMTSFALDDV
jgi:hypothetical protein